MHKLKICFTSNSSPWTRFHGGGQVFVHNLAQNLGKLGHNVTVLYTGPAYNPPTISASCNYKVEWALYFGYPFTPKFRQLNSFTVYQKLKYLNKKQNYEIVNTIGGEALFIPKFCRETGAKLYVSIEHPNLGAIRSNFKWGKPLQSLINVLRRRDLSICRYVCGRADGVITPSLFTKNQAIEYFKLNASKIRVIYHGIIDNMLIENQKTRNRNATGPILFFGRLEPQKGIDLLIKAYHRMVSQRFITEQSLVLIGTGPYEKDYRRLINNLGIADRVVFKGWQSPEHIKDQLADASLCVLPSRSESFGLTMAETLSQNVPLVTTSSGSIPEVVDHGRVAWMAKPNDLDSLFQTIRKALENYQESLRKAACGREHVTSNFSWQKAAKDYEQFYLDTMRN